MARIPPPGKDSEPHHGVAIVIAPAGKMPPPGTKNSPQNGDEGKSSPEQAGVVLDSEHCADCQNYSVDTGDCSKVEGTFAPGDGCAEYFEPAETGESASGGSGASEDQGQS